MILNQWGVMQQPVYQKRWFLVVAVTVVSAVIYFLLAVNYDNNLLPFSAPLKSQIRKSPAPAPSQEPQLPATTRAPPPLAVTRVPPPSATTRIPPPPAVTRLPPLPATTQQSLLPDTRQQELLPGDSNLPYSSPALETLTYPPPSVFTEPAPAPEDSSLKKILFWNDDFYNKHFGFGFGREAFLAYKCRVNTCITTGDRNRFPIEEVDAIIWHFRADDRSLPQTRSPHTRYVFWLMESPMNMHGNLQDYNNVFNWTFTYRLDSDFLVRYGQVFRRRQPLPAIGHNYAAGKTRLAAWFVSHCSTESGRITLVRTLQQWIPVDVFGSCGPFECPRKLEKECYSMLNATYKFYLSFENSLCRDYITEKLFNIFSLDVVPVVYGLGNYSVQAPPGSYIDALSFPSVKALADYLLYLHHNDSAYNEYFRWKRFHQQFPHWALKSQQFCDMCERLHTDNSTNMYDLHQWYVEDAHCKTKYSPDISDFINNSPQVSALSAVWCIILYICILII